MELESFEVEVSTYENGKRIPLGEGAHVTVRSTGSERATKVRERLWKPYATFREVKPEVLDLLNSRWIAQGILVEMVGFTIDGKTLDLDLTSKEDQERLVKILMRPEYKGFRNRIIGLALDETNFQASIDEDLEKNSGSSPARGSSGAKKANE